IPYPNINSGQGLIWYYKNTNGRNLFGHNGGDTGVSTEMFISTSNNLGVIVLSNSSNYNALIQIENAVFDYAEETDFTTTGDINGDDTVNVQDVILMVNLILNNEYNYQVDLNSDGLINVLDVIQLVNIILNN
ncbi:MAG: dockerin type I domain-containing protein, partial [Candidatus Marinimicrobia bacterium]|nr:dockerin type I domain-containing protein [Candidatus Neomarinimicrobiota bacterium]